MIAGLLAALFFGKRQKKKLKVQITDSSGKKHDEVYEAAEGITGIPKTTPQSLSMLSTSAEFRKVELPGKVRYIKVPVDEVPDTLGGAKMCTSIQTPFVNVEQADLEQNTVHIASKEAWI
eukprot:Em0311g2a